MAHRKLPSGTHRIRDHKGTYRTIDIDCLLTAARHVAIEQLAQGPTLTAPRDSAHYVQHTIGALDHEIFCIVWLDNGHKVLRYDELFRGTIDGASVYPREVVKAALEVNAASALLFHNHPSGDGSPSQADIQITEKLKEALSVVEIRVIDHIVIGETCVSFAERGLL